MNLIPSGITRSIGSSNLFLRQNSPTIMFAGGVMGVVAGTVLACRATLKLSDKLPEMRENLEIAKEIRDSGVEDGDAHVGLVYLDNAVQVAKLYGPPVVILGLAIGSLTGSHVTLQRRNAGLTALAAALSKSYDEYRARVRDKIGEQEEKDLYQGVTKVTIEDPDTGKKIKVTQIDPSGTSPYARLFDESSYNFVKDVQYNLAFLQGQEMYANDRLHRRGFLTLNDVLNELGLDCGNTGAQVGWLYDKNDESVGEDRYVDFGLDRYLSDPNMDPREPRIWLDFNVDGSIIGKIKE